MHLCIVCCGGLVGLQVDTAEFEGNKDEYMQERAQEATQRLINKCV